MTSTIPTSVAERVTRLEAFAEDTLARRIPLIAVWSLVVTIALAGVSAVWMASATYQEVAALRSTVDKWEPKIEEITKMIPLQEQVIQLQERVRVLETPLGSGHPGKP